jgi:hypothetical protein
MQLEINGIDLGPPYRATSARPPAVFSFLTTPASPAPHRPTLPRWPAPSSSSPHQPAPPLQAPPTARPWPRRRHRPTAGPPPAADPPPPRPPLYSENPHQRCRSGFTTLPPVSLLEQYRCGSFVGGAQIVEELANREYGGHEDLCGSARQSVIPYVHGRKELY